METLTDTEKLLVGRWLLLLQRHQRLYNIDYSHQCLAGHSKDSRHQTNSRIIQVFEGVDHFFGCLECGQYHICRRDIHSCLVASDHQQQLLYCLYSGQILGVELVANPFTLERDNTVPLIDGLSMNTMEGRRINGSSAKNKSYSNSKDSLPLGKKKKKKRLPSVMREGGKKRKKREKKKEEEEEVEKEAVNFHTGAEEGLDPLEGEDCHKLKKVKKSIDKEEEKKVEEMEVDEFLCIGGGGGGGGGEDDGEEERDGMIGEREVVSDRILEVKERQKNDNYLYWSSYYDFLWEDLSPELQKNTQDSSPISLSSLLTCPPPPIITRTCTHFSFSLITPLIEEEIRCETTLILERLLSLEGVSSVGGGITPLVDLLLEYFFPILKNIYLLVHNSPEIKSLQRERQIEREKRSKYHHPRSHQQQQQNQQKPLMVLTAKMIVPAFLLELILEEYHLNDRNGNFIELWVRNAWTLSILQRNLVSHYYEKFHSTNEKTVRDKVEKSAKDIKKCLTFYQAHPHWLKEFVHFNSLYSSSSSSTESEPVLIYSS